MDLQARDKTWLTKLDQVFCDDASPTFNSDSRDIDDLIVRLRDLLNRRTRWWWNKSFLECYVSKGLIPRGLRVQLFPSFNMDNEEFKVKWEETAKTCSMGFMQLLIKSNESMIKEMEDEIGGIQETLAKHMTAEAMTKLNANLDLDFHKWEKDIVQTKSKKYQRDLSDYKRYRIYKWRRPAAVNRRELPSQTRSNSFSSVSSVDEDPLLVAGSSSQWNERLRPDRSNNGTHNRFKTKRKITFPQSKDKKSKNNLEVINLSSHELSDIQCEVLCLGLTFVPNNNFDFFTTVKDLFLFTRKLILKKLHSKNQFNTDLDTRAEQEALRILEELAGETSDVSTVDVILDS
ncbi:uncharacterized protein LOC143818474 isoform X2 [Ranitomeya variabilis]